MPEKVPRKNTGGILADIRKPHGTHDARFDAINLTRVPKKGPREFSFFAAFGKRAAVVLGILVVLAGAFFAASFGETKQAASETAETVAQNFIHSANALRDFRPDDALVALRKNEDEISGFKSFLGDTHGNVFISIVGSVAPVLRQGLGLFTAVDDLNGKFITLAESLKDLEENGPRYFQTDGSAFIASLERLRDRTREVGGDVQSARNDMARIMNVFPSVGGFGSILGDDYLKYSADLVATEKFLDALIATLKEPGEKHFIVLFQNAAEARPGGGFAGSYADVTIENGQLKNIDVRDIYDPDGQLAVNVVPPQELKTMTRKWGARDANWFFDFPTTAEATLYFLEHSKIYSEKQVTFEGVIAMNTYAFESILDVTGPMELPEYKTTITSANFHDVIQREVEAGNDKIAGEPKRILKVLAPKLLEKMKTLEGGDMRLLAQAVFTHLESKDIMLYAKHRDMANFFAERNLDGGLYGIPNNFFGSYLAVVNANVAGGKTDLFMEQNIEARIDLDTNAGIFTDLTVERAHMGNAQKDPWWKAPNKNFIQIFTNPGVSLVSLKGNDVKTISSKFDYSAAGYERYPALDKIELTRVFLSPYQTWAMESLGKTAFGTWFNVNAGERKKLEVRYQLPAANQNVWDGEVFTFVFERQSGVRSNLKATISAPLGYNFKESGGPLYIFEDKGTAGRIVIPLTLEK